MSEPTDPGTARRSTVPFVVAAVLVLVAAALTVFLVHVRSVRDSQNQSAGIRYGPTADQQAAVQAAATEAANLTTYSRANFAKDFRRALNGATGALKKDVASKRTQTLQVMRQGKFDLSSKVAEAAFESAAGNKVLVLITLNGSHDFGSGTTTPLVTSQRLELTMVRSGKSWLAANLSMIGTS